MDRAKQIKETITDPRGHIKMPPLAFVVCLAFSALLWFFVTLSREYTVTYDYKVTCTDLPAGKKKADVSSDATLRLTFTAKGFEFLSPTFRDGNRDIRLSVKELVKHKGENLNSYQFSQTEITDYLRSTNQWGEEFVGVEMERPMTIYLSK